MSLEVADRESLWTVSILSGYLQDFGEALIYFGAIGLGGEGFALFGGERGGGDA